MPPAAENRDPRDSKWSLLADVLVLATSLLLLMANIWID